jgi:hypothetical protein
MKVEHTVSVSRVQAPTFHMPLGQTAVQGFCSPALGP